MKTPIAFALSLAALLLAVIASPSFANITSYRYSFTCVTGNDPTGASGVLGERTLFVDVSKPFANSEQTLFTFRNEGNLSDTHFIGGVYFYDGVLLKIASIIDADDDVAGLAGGDAGVDFSEGASGDGLSSMDSYMASDSAMLVAGYEYTVVDSADTDDKDASSSLGVHSGETLGVLFDLQWTNALKSQTKAFEDVITGLDDHSIVIGIHVQGLGGYNELFITDHQVTVPAPGALLLGCLGFSLTTWLRGRRVI